MKVATLMLGALAVNCYMLSNGDGDCVVMDIGGSAPVLLRRLEQEGLKLRGILLTHGHYDHIGGVEAVRRQWDVPVYIHPADVPMLTSTTENLGYWIEPDGDFMPVQQWQTVADGDVLRFGEGQEALALTVIHTPGHTKGSVCYLCDGLLFTGDTLFQLSRGRTDFPGGSDREMLDSLRRLSRLEGNYQVLPGHGEASDLDFERLHNPNMRG